MEMFMLTQTKSELGRTRKVLHHWTEGFAWFYQSAVDRCTSLRKGLQELVPLRDEASEAIGTWRVLPVSGHTHTARKTRSGRPWSGSR